MKSLFHSISTLVIVILLAVVVVLFLAWSRTPDILAGSLSRKIKTSVEIDDILFSLNSVEIEKLEIGNLANSILPKAFSAETIDIIAPLKNYFSQKIVIDLIKIDDIYIGLEVESEGSLKSNWAILMNRFKNSAMHHGEKREVVIKKMVFNSISVDVVYRDGSHKIQKLEPIDQLEFTDITASGARPIELIANMIFQKMIRTVLDKDVP